jgi:hypothetical protein
MSMSPRLLRPVASGFDLRSLSGLVQWYDAADQSTMTLNGSTVSEWRSKVGGVAVSQGTAGNQPTLTQNYYNGKSALTFDGGDFLRNASLPIQINGMTAAIVFDETTRVGSAGLLVGEPAADSDFNRSDGFNIQVHGGTNRPAEFLCGVSGNIDIRSPSISETTALGKRVVMARVGTSDGTNGNAAFRFDGQQGSSDLLYGVAGNSTGTLIGGRFILGGVWADLRFNGRLLEVAIWNRSLTVDEAKKVEKYANSKWGTAAV